jgi:hypothetical protein
MRQSLYPLLLLLGLAPSANAELFLLTPDSDGRRVVRLDPTSGEVLNANFIGPDAANLTLPRTTALSADRSRVLVVDQTGNRIQRYRFDGIYDGPFLAATARYANVRGTLRRPNGNLWMLSASGTVAEALVELNGQTGAEVGVVLPNRAGTMASVFDVLTDEAFIYVSASDRKLYRFELATGIFVDELLTIADSFFLQLGLASNGNLLLANLIGNQAGVLELNRATGAVLNRYTGGLSNIGSVYELPGGTLLVGVTIANNNPANGIYEINRSNALVSTKLTGAAARYFELHDTAPALNVAASGGDQ